MKREMLECVNTAQLCRVTVKADLFYNTVKQYEYETVMQLHIMMVENSLFTEIRGVIRNILAPITLHSLYRGQISAVYFMCRVNF